MFKRLLAILLMFITCTSIIMGTIGSPSNINKSELFIQNATNGISSTIQSGWNKISNTFESFDFGDFEFIKSNTKAQTEEDSKFEAYEVDYIIDGDTFFVRTSEGRIKVRLIGVDTPESVASDEYTAKTGKKNTTEGKQASEFTTKTLSGATVWLEYDEEKTDTYGRTLAYVYLDANKETMLQELLLNNGMARCMEIEPNTKYASHFSKLEAIAKANGTGFWSTEVWNEQ